MPKKGVPPKGPGRALGPTKTVRVAKPMKPMPKIPKEKYVTKKLKGI